MTETATTAQAEGHSGRAGWDCQKCGWVHSPAEQCAPAPEWDSELTMALLHDLHRMAKNLDRPTGWDADGGRWDQTCRGLRKQAELGCPIAIGWTHS